MSGQRLTDWTAINHAVASINSVPRDVLGLTLAQQPRPGNDKHCAVDWCNNEFKWLAHLTTPTLNLKQSKTVNWVILGYCYQINPAFLKNIKCCSAWQLKNWFLAPPTSAQIKGAATRTRKFELQFSSNMIPVGINFSRHSLQLFSKILTS